MNLNQPEKPEWDNLREHLRIKLEHLMMSERVGDMLIAECPQCHYQTPIQIETVRSIEQIVDVIFPFFYRFHFELALHYENALYAKSLKEIELTPLQQVMRDLFRDGTLKLSDVIKE